MVISRISNVSRARRINASRGQSVSLQGFGFKAEKVGDAPIYFPGLNSLYRFCSPPSHPRNEADHLERRRPRDYRQIAAAVARQRQADLLARKAELRNPPPTPAPIVRVSYPELIPFPVFTPLPVPSPASAPLKGILKKPDGPRKDNDRSVQFGDKTVIEVERWIDPLPHAYYDPVPVYEPEVDDRVLRMVGAFPDEPERKHTLIVTSQPGPSKAKAIGIMAAIMGIAYLFM
ncbi:hypothetical protein N7478_012010 [Penicillium angulare]|uniref:uncharacterized protein n=1 Tax=Penicillium angulare TaxID=116970 RepID=UPI00253FF939|nr:uncharacterized protein N7478_012010 [Penicillium angulare]KAJ5261415.1 hypothetical protein N7478_012010 [Penicillium angulare]